MEGAWAKASRSRRTEEDCLRAELNREFYKVAIREVTAFGDEMYRPFARKKKSAGCLLGKDEATPPSK